MAAMAGIWNHAAAAAAQSPTAVKPQSGTSGSGGTGTSGTSGTNSATISANDFLTLLVTELQNQDPTAQTDPNAYVNQLVAVNSLEQLININQTLGSATGAPTGGSVPSTAAPAADPAGTGSSARAPQPVTTGAPGNILPAPAASMRVANALSGSHK